MPVILPREAWSIWLGEDPTDKDALLALLKPYPADHMRTYAISTRVNMPKIDDASLLDAVVG